MATSISREPPVIDLYDIWYSEYQLSCMYYMISYDRFGMSISKQRPNRRLKLYASRSIWCWLENLAKALNMSKTFSELTQMLLIKYSRGKSSSSTPKNSPSKHHGCNRGELLKLPGVSRSHEPNQYVSCGRRPVDLEEGDKTSRRQGKDSQVWRL